MSSFFYLVFNIFCTGDDANFKFYLCENFKTDTRPCITVQTLTMCLVNIFCPWSCPSDQPPARWLESNGDVDSPELEAKRPSRPAPPPPPPDLLLGKGEEGTCVSCRPSRKVMWPDQKVLLLNPSGGFGPGLNF